MKIFDWDIEKNRELQKNRKISFEDVIIAIGEGNLLDDIIHPNKNKYSHQRIFIINYNDYAYLVPYVEDEKSIFLKTIIPSRKMTKKYLR